MKYRRLVAALTVAAFLLPSRAEADPSDADRATARALAAQAHKAVDDKDYTTAADLFARANALVHAPTLLLGLARARVELGKLVSAQEVYNQILREGIPPKAPKSFFEALDLARKELAALAPRVSWVKMTVAGGASAKVLLDGVEVPSAAIGVPRAIDPGQHVLTATGDGGARAEATVTVGEGKTEAVTLELKAAAPEPPVAPPIAPAPASPLTSPTPVPAPSAGPAPKPPPVVVAKVVPPPGDHPVRRASESLSHRWQPGLMVRADIDPLNPGVRTAAGLTVGLFDHLELGASALLGRTMGFEPQITAFVLKGAWKPLINAGVPIFFVGGAHVGVRGAAGVQWDVNRHFGIFAQVGGGYFMSVPPGYASAVFLPAVGVQGRI